VGHGQRYGHPALVHPPTSRRPILAQLDCLGCYYLRFAQYHHQHKGYMEVSILDINFRPQFATFDPFGDRLTNWTTDTSGFQTDNPVTLTANGEVIYALIDGLDDEGFWKAVYNNPNNEF
jgi:hypothetical protein